MPYVIRGRIGANRMNSARIGHLTYLAETGDHFYVWNGAHRAAHFASPEAGFVAASQCNGPWFNVPEPATIESIEWARNLETIFADEGESRRMGLEHG
jgi:hypothetical protein